jgi:hypothetical protein
MEFGFVLAARPSVSLKTGPARGGPSAVLSDNAHTDRCERRAQGVSKLIGGPAQPWVCWRIVKHDVAWIGHRKTPYANGHLPLTNAVFCQRVRDPTAANGLAQPAQNDWPAHRASPSHRADREMPARDIRLYRRYLAPTRGVPELWLRAATPFPFENGHLMYTKRH